MEGQKVIEPHRKFTSELDMSIAADREEMDKRVFGRDHKKDSHGKPIEQSRTSEFAIKNGIARAGDIEADLRALAKSEGGQAAKVKAQRIAKLDIDGKYALALKPHLDWVPPSTAPEHVPRVSDI